MYILLCTCTNKCQIGVNNMHIASVYLILCWQLYSYSLVFDTRPYMCMSSFFNFYDAVSCVFRTQRSVLRATSRLV